MPDPYEYIPGEGVRDRALPRSVTDWTYDTDLTLVHSSGLKVFFPRRSAGLDGLTRAKCIGYSVDDVKESAFADLNIRPNEPFSHQHIERRLLEAEAIFHNSPAGSPDAPRSVKRDRLLRLAKLRQATQWDGYRQIRDFQSGAYECDHVSPITKSAGVVDAKIFILFRDWAKEITLLGEIDRSAKDLGCTRGERLTQSNLTLLLRRHLGYEFGQTYATCLFPFIRRGEILQNDLERAAVQFAIPQIEIVAPKIVICLGIETFNVLRRIRGLKLVKDLAQGIEEPFRFVSADIWIQAHTGFYGKMIRNSGIDEAWNVMATAFKRIRPS